jgi:hypothetical protein
MDLGKKARKMTPKRKIGARFQATRAEFSREGNTASNQDPFIGQDFLIPAGSGSR